MLLVQLFKFQLFFSKLKYFIFLEVLDALVALFKFLMLSSDKLLPSENHEPLGHSSLHVLFFETPVDHQETVGLKYVHGCELLPRDQEKTFKNDSEVNAKHHGGLTDLTES